MKIFLALLALVSCVFAAEWAPKNEEQIKQIHIECIRTHALTAEQFVQVRKIHLTNDKEIRNYFRCEAEKIGVYSSDPGFYADRLAKQFKKDREENEVKSCAEEYISRYYKPNQGDKGDVEVRNCFMTVLTTGEDIKEEALKHLEASQRRNKTLSY